ncbi:MAG TPA: LuxR C-terminal-related transcriptional regulator [Nocardioides sp.]|nr:LuxR C-terminal-related transcriptional regulator [Nocardioides sp.]
MELREARTAYAERAWQRAYDAFAAAESEAPLDAEDYDRFAVSAHLLARLPDYFAIRERAYKSLLERGDHLAAAESALWVGIQKLVQGEVAEGGGWVARGARIVAEDGTDSKAAGFLDVARAVEVAMGGDPEEAARMTGECVQAARRHGSDEYAALGLHQQGMFLLAAGRTDEGFACMDEAMLGVAAGECSALVEGIIYCNVISACWSVYELTRAQQWTDAMTRWVASQPEMCNFSGECKVRRAELQQLHGRWADALDELDGVTASDGDRWVSGIAASVRGNLDRLSGRFDEAEELFSLASKLGEDPQPGLALLRLARGSVQAAAAMVRRSLAETHQPGRRIPVLAAATEILLAVGETEAAEAAADELCELATVNRSPVVAALGRQAQASVRLAGGAAAEALPLLRDALGSWVRTAAPYEEARTRVLVADACRALGDRESADRELDAARAIFEELGAAPDLARLTGTDAVLSPRELEVLKLLATGATNRGIAEQLVLSERTVDRHVSNIFGKLGVTSRTAATAYAFDRQLV